MKSERWQRIEQLYHAALEHDPAPLARRSLVIDSLTI